MLMNLLKGREGLFAVVMTFTRKSSVAIVIFAALALIFAITFKLNKRTHGILVDEIDRLKAGGSKS